MTTRAGIAAAALVVLGAGGTYALAATVAQPVHACAGRRTGALRLAARCRRGERSVTWGLAGPPGPAGSPGSAGATGAAGTTGATGVQGPAAPQYFAKVDSTGAVLAGSGRILSWHPGTGVYELEFPAVLTDCAVIASEANLDTAFGGAAGGVAIPTTFTGGDSDAEVHTNDASGAPADSAFAIAVFC